MSNETISLSDLQRFADDILSGFAMDVIRPAAIKKLCEAVKEVATPIPSEPKTWAKPPTAAAIRWMVGEVELDAAFKLRSDRTLLLCSMVREFLKGTADEETEPAAKPMMLRTLIKSQGKPSPFVAKACTTDFWQATGPVPTTTPEALREWLHNNPQLTDDARVKFLLGMCHAALGELLKERDEAKAATARGGGWHADGPAPDDADSLCAFIENNHLTHDPLMVDLLTKCRLALQYTGKHIRELLDEHHAVARAVRGEHSPAEKNDLADRVAALFDKQWAVTAKKDPWQATSPIPEDAMALCGFILNNTLTDDWRMAELLGRCESAIQQLTNGNKVLLANQTALEGILGAGWSDPEGKNIIDVARQMSARFDQIKNQALPNEVASLEQQIVEAKEAWDQGDGRSINEVFRSAEQLLWTVRAQILARNDGAAGDGASTAGLSAQHARQLAELQRENARLNEELTSAKTECSVARKHAEEAEGRAALNESKAIEEGHRVIAAQRRLTELTSLLDQRLEAPLTGADRDLSDIDQVLNRTTLLVTLCSGAPWSLSEADDNLVLDADRRPVASISEPTPGNVEIRRYNGEFIAASRGLIVHLVEVCRRLVAGVRSGRINNAALQSLGSDKDKKIAAVTEELRKARVDRDVAVQQKLAEDAAVVEQREADLKRLIGKQQAAAEARYDELAATKERLHQTLAEVVGLRDCVDGVQALRLETEAKLETANKELTKAIEDERFVSVAADRLRDQLDEVKATVAIKEKELANLRAGLEGYQRRIHLQQSHMDELANGIRAYRELADGRADDIRENCWWTRSAVAWEKEHGGRVLASCDTPSPDKPSSEAPARQPSHFVEFAAAALAVCSQNGWKRDWQHGGGYLHLEASEFVEALRGKGDSTPEAEAADVLFVLLSVCAANSVSVEKALSHLRELCHLSDGRIDIDSGAVYLIQDSRTYVGNDVSWWRPDSEGYTCQIDEAGLYTEDFCRRLRSTDVVWRAADIFPLATRVVDVQRIHSADLKPVVFDKKPDGEQ